MPILLLLDLDETCISAKDFIGSKDIPDLESFKLKDASSDQVDMIVFKRPNLTKFLSFIQSNPDIIVGVWSAGEKNYVLDIVQNIFGCMCKPNIILWDTTCERSVNDTGYLKSLKWLKDTIGLGSKYDLFLIDDLKENIDANPTNSYLIPPFDAYSVGAAADGNLDLLMTRILETFPDLSNLSRFNSFPITNELQLLQPQSTETSV